jgi:hypothetical protein
MVANRRIYIRVTCNQFERFRVNAHANGFGNISNYVRTLALEKDLCFQNRFNKLYSKVMDEPTLTVKRLAERPLTAFI